MPSVTPMIILNTDIIDIESGVSRRTAIVGEPLNWEMDGPGETVKSGYFGHQVNSDSDLVCFILQLLE